MATDEQQTRREDCRREVRAYLAARPAIALDVASIRRGLASWDFTASEVMHACVFLFSLNQLKEELPDIGSTKYYQISATGTLAHERNQ